MSFALAPSPLVGVVGGGRFSGEEGDKGFGREERERGEKERKRFKEVFVCNKFVIKRVFILTKMYK